MAGQQNRIGTIERRNRIALAYRPPCGREGNRLTLPKRSNYRTMLHLGYTTPFLQGPGVVSHPLAFGKGGPGGASSYRVRRTSWSWPAPPLSGEPAASAGISLRRFDSSSTLPLARGLGVEDAIPSIYANQHKPATKINEDRYTECRWPRGHRGRRLWLARR